jgi:hypothetical protein
MVTMEHTESNPQFSKAHPTTLNISNFKMIKDEIKNYCIKVSLNGINSIPNFMQIWQAVQKLLVANTLTDWWYDKPTLIFGKYIKNTPIHVCVETFLVDLQGIVGGLVLSITSYPEVII